MTSMDTALAEMRGVSKITYFWMEKAVYERKNMK